MPEFFTELHAPAHSPDSKPGDSFPDRLSGIFCFEPGTPLILLRGTPPISWIPAFAGMTTEENVLPSVIPAKAGIQGAGHEGLFR